MRIQVIRGAGTKQAPGIVDPLLSGAAAGVQRGRNELDEHGFNKRIYDCSMPYRAMPVTGSVMEVSDAESGEMFRGKLIGYSHTVNAAAGNEPLKIITRAVIERSMT